MAHTFVPHNSISLQIRMSMVHEFVAHNAHILTLDHIPYISARNRCTSLIFIGIFLQK